MSIGLTISSTDRGKYLVLASPRFSRTLGERGSGSVTLRVTDGYTPAIGEDVGLWDGATRVFGGTIEDVRTVRLAPGLIQHDLSISSQERKADKRTVSRSFSDMDSGAIVSSILANELAGEAVAGTVDAGAHVSRIVFDHITVAEAIGQLATLSNYVWWEDADSHLSFVPRSTSTPGYTLTGADVLYGATVSQNRADYRNVQHLRVNWAAFSDTEEEFLGDGSATSFALARPVAEIVSVTVFDGVYATVAGTFSGLPADGDHVVINGVTYTFKIGLTQTTPRQVLIGADAADCALALAAAVNRADAGYGTLYSAATNAHPNCRATQPVGASMAVYFNSAGLGNGAPVSATGAEFAWAASSMSGAGAGTTTAQTFGSAISDSQWQWAAGSTTITQADPSTPLPATSLLTVIYRALGADVVTIRDWTAIAERQAAEGGTGIYEQLTEDTSIVDGNIALATCQAILDAYKVIPTTIEYHTLKHDLTPGQVIDVAISSPDVSGNFMVQSIDASYVPFAEADLQHFTYIVKLIDQTRVKTWLQFWESLGKSVNNAVISGGQGGASLNYPPMSL